MYTYYINIETTKLISKLPRDAKVGKIFEELATRYKDRPGGYIRIVKKGFRYGDAAPMAIVELVDRNEDAKNQDVPEKKLKKNDPVNKSTVHIGSWSSNVKSWKEFKKVNKY